MMRMSVTSFGIREVSFGLATLNDRIDVVTRKNMHEAVKHVRDQVRAATPKGVGRPTPHLADSWVTRVNTSRGLVTGRVFANASQPPGKVGAIEFGATYKSFPNISAIQPWSQAKIGGGLWGAYLVARQLKVRGYRAKYPLAKGLKASEGFVLAKFEKSIYDAIAFF